MYVLPCRYNKSMQLQNKRLKRILPTKQNLPYAIDGRTENLTSLKYFKQ